MRFMLAIVCKFSLANIFIQFTGVIFFVRKQLSLEMLVNLMKVKCIERHKSHRKNYREQKSRMLPDGVQRTQIWRKLLYCGFYDSRKHQTP